MVTCLNPHHCSAADVSVTVVGGAAFLCGPALKGGSRIVKPPHADVANAVGAAISQVQLPVT